MTPRIAIDTGGTFTDLVARAPDGTLTRLKVPSTPDDPGRAVLAALAALAARAAAPIDAPVRHGTTVATNALLERRGARVVGVTTHGFEDILRLRRQARPDLYALHPTVPPPLIAPEDMLGVRGRRDHHGQNIEPHEDIPPWITRHHTTLARAEAFAICLLHGYLDATDATDGITDEAIIAAALAQAFPHVPITTGHALAPVFREYERAATVAVNAFLAPVMSTYLARLGAAVGDTLTVMGSAGGLLTAAEAAAAPVHTVLSGPAGGVRGAWRVGRRCGRTALLTLDMGGTSTDVSVVRGALAPEDDGHLEDHPLRVPLLPIETVGAGGGSIAHIDAGGALRVGPRSAGAIPGPACYGHAGPAAEPTVTDAHVVLGRIPSLLGGAHPLDAAAARAAVARLADKLGASLEETAEAMLALAEANMARACKRVTMARGIDPRELTLVAFGGAGGLHACALADALGCPDVIFPAEPGVLSADGMIDAPREVAATRTLLWSEPTWTDAALAAVLADIDATLRARLPQGTRRQYLADGRYTGQTHTLALPLDGTPTAAALREAFDALHAERYGYTLDRPVELVALRGFLRAEDTDAQDIVATPTQAIEHGPAAISTYSATLYLPPGWQAVTLSTGDRLCTRTADRIEHIPTRLSLALDIHRQRLAAIAEEMGATLMRAAFSANIKERRDFSCAVFDARGQMLCHAAHIPVHLGSTPLSVQAAIEAIPMTPGTQVLLNDPFAGGTHLPDVTLVTPVFLPGDPRPAYYVANRAHHADIGGVSPGSLPAPRRPDGTVRPLTIDDEGFRLPPTALDDTLRARFAAASRLPDERHGDLRAQEAANRLGAARITALAHALGPTERDRLDAALLDYAERRMRAVLRSLPDGTHTFTDHLDDDGVGDEAIPLPVTVTLRDDTALVDFTAAPDAVAGPLNAVRAIAVSAVFYAFRCLAGEAIPANAGLLRPIEIRTRPGSIVDALPPAAVSAGNVETSQRLVDALFGALARFAPDRVPAAACGSMNNVLFGGHRPDGAPFVHYETLAGGGGGGPAGPGADAIHVHMTNTLNTPIEAIERDFPVRIERYAVRPPAEAIEGIKPGGAGVIRRYRFLAPAEVSLITERRRGAAWGHNGAPPGARGRNRHLRADGTITELPGKAAVLVAAGEAIEIETPGGGSWKPAKGAP
ncbi:MAG: hydantoinase B/oxoprolinase family protein [bacterium]